LAQNHLVVVDLLFQSTAWLVANSPKNIPMNLIQALREATDEP
jgi:ATP phosphoribosyltransferase